LSHLLPHSRVYYETATARELQIRERIKTFNEATNQIQLEHKRRAVELELKKVENRVLKELNIAEAKQLGRTMADVARAIAWHGESPQPGGKPSIMISKDGTVSADYGFTPVGQRILTRAEFTKLINTLLDRLTIETLSLDLSAGDIVRRYFMEQVTPG